MSEVSAYRIDVDNGIVFGIRGKPITKRAKGYVHVWNRSPASNISISAHRLIWESVHGPIPAGMQINHINGVKHDNRIVNLELVTASQNTAHAYRLGFSDARGVRSGRAVGKRRALEGLR